MFYESIFRPVALPPVLLPQSVPLSSASVLALPGLYTTVLSKFASEHPNLQLPSHSKGPGGSECEDIRKTRIDLHHIVRIEDISCL